MIGIFPETFIFLHVINASFYIYIYFRLYRHRLLGGTGCVCYLHVLRPHAAHQDRSSTSRVSNNRKKLELPFSRFRAVSTVASISKLTETGAGGKQNVIIEQL